MTAPAAAHRLVDGGTVCVPAFGTADAAGAAGWHMGIEQHGIEPDTVVDNLPCATFRGEDAQLAAAVAHINVLMDADPVRPPVRPPGLNLARPRFRRDFGGPGGRDSLEVRRRSMLPPSAGF